MDLLIRIKKLVIARRVIFTEKARCERLSSGLTIEDVFESIINAPSINKILISKSFTKKHLKEKLCVIIGVTFDGLLIYTKGIVRKVDGKEEFYILVSSKLSRL